MTRFKISYALAVLGVITLFAAFILFRNDAALISALNSAGAVAAAVFAAVAAFGSVRAADESSAAARRAHEAVARNAQPRLLPSFSIEGENVLGTVSCGSNRGAADVMIVWVVENAEMITQQWATFEAGTGFTVDLNLPLADLQRDFRYVWIDYWDEGRTGHWRDTWRLGTQAPHQSALVLSESQLAG